MEDERRLERNPEISSPLISGGSFLGSSIQSETGVTNPTSSDSETSEESSSQERTENDRTVEINELGFGPIVTLHSELWSRLMSPNDGNGLDMKEFFTLFLKLRDFFICSVCRKLVTSEFIITSIPNSACESLHLVCKGCEGGNELSPCSLHTALYNRDLNPTSYSFLKVLCDSFKGFCSLFIQTPETRNMIQLTGESDPTFEALTFVNYLTEGALSTLVHSSQTLPFHESEEVSRKEKTLKDSSTTLPEFQNSVQNFNRSYWDGDAVESLQLLSSTNTQNNVEVNVLPHLNPQIPHSNPSSPTSQLIQIFHPHGPANWPDPNHVIQYASGNITIPQATTYNFPISLPKLENPKEQPTNDFQTLANVRKISTNEQKKLKVRKLESKNTFQPHLPEKMAPSVPDDGLTLSTTKIPRKGCRCGNATPMPGKLTCCGQRCPCYVERKLCVDCRCKGCRNPHQSNGDKTLASQEIPSGDASNEMSSVSASSSIPYHPIPEVPQAAFTSVYPMNHVGSYASFPIPVQLPMSLVEFSSLIQSTPHFGINKY